jgi:hypothetical protein
MDAGFDARPSGKPHVDAGQTIDAGMPGDDDAVDSGEIAPPISDDAGARDAALPPATLADLLALTQHCEVASTAKYSPHTGLPATVDICKLNGGFFYTSEMLIDCDGQAATECAKAKMRGTQTATRQSDGKPLNPVKVPFIVLPDRSARFDYVAANIQEGAVAIAIYNGRMVYGIFGDTGPADMIGQGSYAMAKALGINPDPLTGGAPSGVTYFVFSGAGTRPVPTEDPAAAATLGAAFAARLVADNAPASVP